jgi:hypothetical protein
VVERRGAGVRRQSGEFVPAGVGRGDRAFDVGVGGLGHRADDASVEGVRDLGDLVTRRWLARDPVRRDGAHRDLPVRLPRR